MKISLEGLWLMVYRLPELCAKSSASLSFDSSLCLSKDCIKCLFISNSQICKNLAVQFDIGSLQAFHEAGVSKTAVANSSGNTSNPQTTELSLTTLAVTVFILPSLVNSVLCVAEEFAAETAETLSTQENALTTLARGRSVSSTWHRLFLSLS